MREHQLNSAHQTLNRVGDALAHISREKNDVYITRKACGWRAYSPMIVAFGSHEPFDQNGTGAELCNAAAVFIWRKCLTEVNISIRIAA